MQEAAARAVSTFALAWRHVRSAYFSFINSEHAWGRSTVVAGGDQAPSPGENRPRKGWIAVDLDGTLAQYRGWNGIDHIGPPVPAMVNRVKDWLDQGIEVRIFTARVSRRADRHIAVKAIGNWCEQQGLPRLPVTNVKDFGMIELWDDRAVRVQTNRGERADAA